MDGSRIVVQVTKKGGRFFEKDRRIPEPKGAIYDRLYLEGIKENPSLGVYSAARLLEYARKMHPKGYVLDVACGSGKMAFKLANDTTQKVIGIDLSTTAITLAKQNYKKDNLEFMVGSVYDLKNALGSDYGNASVVTCGYSLHHFDELDNALENMSGTLHNEGWLCIQDFDRETAEEDIMKIGLPEPMLAELYRSLNKFRGERLVQKLRNSGFLQHSVILTYFSNLASYSSIEVKNKLEESGFLTLCENSGTPTGFVLHARRKTATPCENSH